MSGAEIVAVISGILNILGFAAGLFGWKKHRALKQAAEEIERVGEAVIHGVEAAGRNIGADDAARLKRTIQSVAETAGVESILHRWLIRLGLAKH